MLGKALGAFGETYASHELGRRGYQILERNVRFPIGEIDIVAWEGDELVFIEVKTRRKSAIASPEDSLSHERLRHLESAIDLYMEAKHSSGMPYRIEIVALDVDRSGRVMRCEVLGDAGLR